MVALGETTEQQVTKAVLRICQPNLEGGSLRPGAEKHAITFQFNPKEYAVKASASWTKKPGKHGVRPPQFTGGNAATMSLEMFIDAQTLGSGPSLIDTVDILLGCVQPTKESTKDKPFPPVLEFSWGSRRFVTVADNVSAKFTMFDQGGDPIRAKVTISLTVFDGSWPKQNPTSGTPRIDSAHLVALGDTLPSIAHLHYGDPTLWRALAVTNGIDNPAVLPVGSRIVVPTHSEAVKLS